MNDEAELTPGQLNGPEWKSWLIAVNRSLPVSPADVRAMLRAALITGTDALLDAVAEAEPMPEPERLCGNPRCPVTERIGWHAPGITAEGPEGPAVHCTAPPEPEPEPRYLGGQWSPEHGFSPIERVSAYPAELIGSETGALSLGERPHAPAHCDRAGRPHLGPCQEPIEHVGGWVSGARAADPEPACGRTQDWWTEDEDDDLCENCGRPAAEHPEGDLAPEDAPDPGPDAGGWVSGACSTSPEPPAAGVTALACFLQWIHGEYPTIRDDGPERKLLERAYLAGWSKAAPGEMEP